jgi:hypothetical protein
MFIGFSEAAAGPSAALRQAAPYFIRDQAPADVRALSVLMEFEQGSSLLIEHGLFRNPVSTPGSSPGAGFFGIML